MTIRPFCLAALAATALPVQAGDALFNSGLEPGLVIQGHTVYAPRLPGGIVRARAGAHEVAVAIRADGGYALVLEERHLGADPTVLLTARGDDDLAHVVWAGQLGPASRLEAAAADGILVAAEEPLANLGPWSTAASAAMWAGNGFVPIQDGVAYEREIRRLSSATFEVAPALALVARGALALPAGHDDTWTLLSTLAGAQALVAAYRELEAQTSCTDTPAAPLCEVRATLAFDQEAFPAMAPLPGVGHGPTFPRQQVPGRQGLATLAPGGTGELLGIGGVAVQPVVWQATAEGRWRVSRPDSQPLVARTQFVFIPGTGQIPRELRTVAMHLRLAAGPGGLPMSSWADEIEYSHPDHPQVPGGSFPPGPGWVYPDASQVLPPALQAQVPALQGRLLLPVPQVSPDPSLSGSIAYAYDILDFQSGMAQRSGESFTVSAQPAADRFSLAFPGGRNAHYQVVSEDGPESWRVLMRVDAAVDKDHAQGIALVVDSPPSAFTGANVPGAWRFELNASTCRGAWGEIGALDPFNFCGPPYFGFQFDPGGTGTGLTGGQITWQVLGGGNAGRLELTRLSGANATQRRGYEIIQDRGGRRWALENWSNQVGDPVPPMTAFVPTHRLTELVLLPD